MAALNRKAGWLFAMFFLLIPLFFINVRPYSDWGDDFAQYIRQAINFAEGHPQNADCYIYNPDYPKYAPPLYPVGFPLLLSPVYALKGNSISAFNCLLSAILFLWGLIMFVFFRRLMQPLEAILLTLVAVYNPWMISFKSSVLADIPFSFFFLTTVLFYLFFREQKKVLFLFLTVFTAAFAALIKPLGLLLLPAFAADIFKSNFKNGEWRNAPIYQYASLLVLPAVVYFLISHLLMPQTEYVGHFSSFYSGNRMNVLFNRNAMYYMERFSENFQHANPGWEFLGMILKSFVLTFFLIGFFGKIFNRFGLFEIICLLFIPVIILYPYADQGFRYMLPLLPFLLMYIYHGFESMSVGGFSKRYVFAAACLVCLFQYKTPLQKIWEQRNLPAPWGPQETSAAETFKFIREQTEKNAVIAFIKPRALSLYTGRRALTNAPDQDNTGISRFFEKNQVRYFLTCSELDNPPLNNYLAKESASLIVVWDNRKFVLYRKFK